MKIQRDDKLVIGAGMAACAVCCAGPILGFFAALGLGTLASTWVFGAGGLLVAAVVSTTLVVRRRRRKATECSAPSGAP